MSRNSDIFRNYTEDEIAGVVVMSILIICYCTMTIFATLQCRFWLTGQMGKIVFYVGSTMGVLAAMAVVYGGIYLLIVISDADHYAPSTVILYLVFIMVIVVGICGGCSATLAIEDGPKNPTTLDDFLCCCPPPQNNNHNAAQQQQNDLGDAELGDLTQKLGWQVVEDETDEEQKITVLVNSKNVTREEAKLVLEEFEYDLDKAKKAF